MKTGKNDRVCYEVGDVLVRRGYPDDIFLIERIERKIAGVHYYVVREKNLFQVICMKGRMEMEFIFKPHIESTGFYK
jgi:hypothetical protein